VSKADESPATPNPSQINPVDVLAEAERIDPSLIERAALRVLNRQLQAALEASQADRGA
jgi:hypothetical protein